VGLIALVAVAGGAGGIAGARAGQPAETPVGRTAAAGPSSTVNTESRSGLDVAAVLEAVGPAVADIVIRGTRGTGEGSGIVYSADGLVLTNAHVLQGATSVTVTTPSDRQARRASVLGVDRQRDVAVLRIDDARDLVYAQLGSSAEVRVGADVVAIGNALGLRGDPSVTRGIVSALERSVGDLTGMLQTDAAINPGNSGGPLVNAAGQVIGINTAVLVEGNAQNIGFAIPIDTARSVAERIVSGKPAGPLAFLGVSTSDDPDTPTGAKVAAVTPGSPAAEAGLMVGDTIVAVDDSPVAGAAALGRLVADRAPGDTVDLTIIRDGESRTLRATLGQREPDD
jgi:putative serine protease PepD